MQDTVSTKAVKLAYLWLHLAYSAAKLAYSRLDLAILEGR